MKLEDAERVAEAIRSFFEPACHRVEIAGSIRRRQPEVKDVELVYIPKVKKRTTDLFGEAEEEENLLHAHILENLDLEQCVPIKPGVQGIERWPLKPKGRYWRFWLGEPNLKLDCFRATEENWGLIYAIRTGSGVGPDGHSPGFSQGLLQRWKRLTGGRSKGGMLRLRDGSPVEVPDEDTLFRLLKMRFVPPEERYSAETVIRFAEGLYD